jgi:hypothetical protein
MGEKKTSTSIEFTDAAKQSLKRLAVRDSQKNIVSAGVIVFERLTPEQREAAIAEANGVENIKLTLQNESEDDIKKLWSEVEKIAKKIGVKIQKPTD